MGKADPGDSKPRRKLFEQVITEVKERRDSSYCEHSFIEVTV